MKPKRDARAPAAILTAALVFLGGLVVTVIPRESPDGATAAGTGASRPHAAEIDERFRQGVVMLHAKRYEYAVAAFHQVLKYAPDLPEAHVDMGYALVGLGQYKPAYDFFESATTLRPQQANAYYGMALALEGMGDIRGAIGAMRTYLHLVDAADPHRRKAESALWEWEGSLKSQK
ncbi:MAG: tetratricopeptide repeat protein [Betaproteobacteria bacterium]